MSACTETCLPSPAGGTSRSLQSLAQGPGGSISPSSHSEQSPGLSMGGWKEPTPHSAVLHSGIIGDSYIQEIPTYHLPRGSHILKSQDSPWLTNSHSTELCFLIYRPKIGMRGSGQSLNLTHLFWVILSDDQAPTWLGKGGQYLGKEDIRNTFKLMSSQNPCGMCSCKSCSTPPLKTEKLEQNHNSQKCMLN